MSTHHGFIREFPSIRVDAFDGKPAIVNPYFDGEAPCMYLLTHSHTDHVTGLNSPSFAGIVYCTAVTKHFTTETSEAAERVRGVESLLPPKKKFDNLFVRPAQSTAMGRKKRVKLTTKEMMRELHFNVPEVIETRDGSVTVTAIDANHCPGSSMFLIEGIDPQGISRAVLVTGDIRAESSWLQQLTKIPALAKYMPNSNGKGKGKRLILDCIYLDTSQVMVTEPRVSKKIAVDSCVRDMKRFPLGTKFFINCWTWGYEELLKGIHLSFNSKIHIDQYKYDMYTHSSTANLDPILASLGTTNEKATRFHACERRWRCDEVWEDGLGCYCYDDQQIPLLRGPKKKKQAGKGNVGSSELVYINCWGMSVDRFDSYRDEMESKFAKVEAGDEMELPKFLICPIARHSALPELQAFVNLFQPSTIYPLVVNSDLKGMDCRALPALFGNFLGPGGSKLLESQIREFSIYIRKMDLKEKESREQELDLFIAGMMGKRSLRQLDLWDNLEGGDDATAYVKKWTTEDSTISKSKLIKSISSSTDYSTSNALTSKQAKVKPPVSTTPEGSPIKSKVTKSISYSTNTSSSTLSKVSTPKQMVFKSKISTTPDGSPCKPFSFPLFPISNLPTIRLSSTVTQHSSQTTEFNSTSSSSILRPNTPDSIMSATPLKLNHSTLSDISVNSLSRSSEVSLIRYRTTPLDEDQKKIIKKIRRDRKKRLSQASALI